MFKIAVIFDSSPFDRKGLFNAVHERIRHLSAAGEYQVDAYCIQSRDNAFTRAVRHTPEAPCLDVVNLDGVVYNMLWYRFSILDHILTWKLYRKPCFFRKFISSSLKRLEGYDIVIAHSFTGGLLAYELNKKSGTPYFVTWHGSDIHTHPWRNPMILKDTKLIMSNAKCNFFVSKALMAYSERILPGVCKQVLYNGVSEAFYRFTDVRRAELRTEYGVDGNVKIVAFVGSLAAVKNVRALQPVFHNVKKDFGGNVQFWIVGDGKLRRDVESDMAGDASLDVRFFGNMPAEKMPDIMNCIDVLVLPSINEGLGMVCAEAIRCGAAVVGSAVGGIPEVVGKDSVVPLGDGFAGCMAQKIICRLNAPVQYDIPSELSWHSTCQAELAALKSVLQ